MPGGENFRKMRKTQKKWSRLEINRSRCAGARECVCACRADSADQKDIRSGHSKELGAMAPSWREGILRFFYSTAVGSIHGDSYSCLHCFDKVAYAGKCRGVTATYGYANFISD